MPDDYIYYAIYNFLLMNVKEFGSKFKILFSSGTFAAHGVWLSEVGVSSLKNRVYDFYIQRLDRFVFLGRKACVYKGKELTDSKIISIIFAS